MSTLLLDSGTQLFVCLRLCKTTISSKITIYCRYFYTGESVLSKLVDNEIVALMTDNMYQVVQLIIKVLGYITFFMKC